MSEPAARCLRHNRANMSLQVEASVRYKINAEIKPNGVFFVLQAMRTLSWKPHLGSVTLDVELEDRTLANLTVSPFHAAIILHFQEKSTGERVC